MPLTALSIRAAKPRERPYKLADGGGLYLEVQPSGALYWRLKFRLHGKEKRLALGVYPQVSLAEARDGREAAKKLLRDGVDPSAKRRSERLSARQAVGHTFDAVAEEWLRQVSHELSPATLAKKRWLCDEILFPWLRGRPMTQIEPPEVLAVLRRTESRNKLESTHRAKQLVSQVFRYAIVTGRATRDPTVDLKGALKSPVHQKRAAITDPRQVGPLLRAIDGYWGQPATCAALRLAPLVFVRPGELRAARWSEFDFDVVEEPRGGRKEPCVWRIPAARMKMDRDHLVPLSRQAVQVLREIHRYTGNGLYVFPSARTSKRPLSENTINVALRNLGFGSDTMTGHGFKAMASTLLNEKGYREDVIERQLAHVEKKKVRAAYNRAEYIEERRRMMQDWADYLDGLKHGAVVVPIRSVRA